jgi:putative oxidoreductase
MSPAVSTGLLILRLVAGLTIAGHGAQKALGWFGGAGFAGTVSGFAQRGPRPGTLWAALAVLGELGGGLSVATGFLIPLGAAGMVGAMLMAIAKVHWRNGFWNAKRGIEFPLQLLAAAVALGITGAGRYSLDALFGLHLPVWVFLVLALAALITDGVGLALSRPTAPATTGAPPSQAQ